MKRTFDRKSNPERAGCPKRRIWWKRIEHATLLFGLVGSATACLSSYGWHWFKESLFYMIWSSAPYCLFLLGSHIAHRLVKSRILYPITTLLAVAMTFLSLLAYIEAVRHPNHSSGMVFGVLPLFWMVAVPVVLTIIIMGFLAANHSNWN